MGLRSAACKTGAMAAETLGVLLEIGRESGDVRGARFGALGQPQRRRNDMVCEWFALCENEATILVPHPVLDTVPCCDRCASKLDLKGTPIFIPGESLG